MSVALVTRCVPPPFHIQSRVRRDQARLAALCAARAARLERALARRPAYNPIACERLFGAIAASLAPQVPVRRLAGRRHQALLAEALSAARPASQGGEGPAGYAVERVLCLAGKQVGQRAILAVLEASAHAAARFLERSAAADNALLHDALAEAAAQADAVLLAHLDGPCAPRLRRGAAPVLLPAGEGAFLGWLRLLPPRSDGWPRPVIEARTWVHEVALTAEQAAARDVLRAGLPPAVLPHALAEAWAGLRAPASGPGWHAAGCASLPLAAPGMAHRNCPAANAARLALGLAGPDEVAADLPQARRALLA